MDHLQTEARNPASAELDELSPLQIVRLMNAASSWRWTMGIAVPLVRSLVCTNVNPPSHAMSSRLLASAELRRTMGQAARRRAIPFGWDQVAGRVEDFYRGVLTRARSEQRSDR